MGETDSKVAVANMNKDTILSNLGTVVSVRGIALTRTDSGIRDARRHRR
jgi:hypothetical protein